MNHKEVLDLVKIVMVACALICMVTSLVKHRGNFMKSSASVLNECGMVLIAIFLAFQTADYANSGHKHFWLMLVATMASMASIVGAKVRAAKAMANVAPVSATPEPKGD